MSALSRRPSEGESIPPDAADGDEVERLRRRLEREVRRRARAESIAERATRDMYLKVEELGIAHRELERFTHLASHDIQEHIRNVLSYIQLIERRYGGALDHDGRTFLGYASDAVRRLHVLVEDVARYSRLSESLLHARPVPLNEVFDAAAADLAAVAVAAGGRITRDDLPVVQGDRPQLAAVMHNLVQNALKYRREEPPEVHVSATREPAGWRISVRDNGIGIESRYQEQVFTMFTRLHPRDSYPGSGLGLAIAKRIVENHRGRIWVESTAGRGSTFHFFLPDVPTGHVKHEPTS